MFESINKSFDHARRDEEAKQEQPKKASPPSLVPFPKQVKLDPTIISGTATATVVTPKTRDGSPSGATMSARVIGGIGPRFFDLTDTYANGAATMAVDHPVDVRFQPKFHGTHEGELACEIKTEDGLVEHRTVELVAEGVDSRKVAESGETLKPNIKDLDPDLVEELRKETSAAQDKAANLAEAQNEGVEVAEKEVGSFTKAPPKGPWWASLIEAAISIGTAGMGGALAGFALKGIATKIAGSAVEKIIEGAVGEGVQSAFDEAAGDRLKAYGQTVAADAWQDKEPGQAHEPTPTKFSSNPRINFFTAQHVHYKEVGAAYRKVISRQETVLQHTMHTDARASIDAMVKIKEACNDTYGLALNAQAAATEKQWVIAVARGVAGQQVVMGPGFSFKKVTDFTKGYGTSEDKKHARGLLALFGKRTDVKSSNDRNANLETNFLLQRLETFRGICLLTTNHESSMDPAFQRRITLHLRFRVPEAWEREHLWRAVLPSDAPLDAGIDFAQLAQKYEMSGGYIKNAAVRAAFAAAHENRPIAMSHLEKAARFEYQSMGKITAEA